MKKEFHVLSSRVDGKTDLWTLDFIVHHVCVRICNLRGKREKEYLKGIGFEILS